MRQLGYYLFKGWIALGLFCYYRKIEVIGLENVPKGKPVLFLSNHQNALLDILLIATRCNRKPWYLTRADVFKSKLFRPLFTFLQMIPIYRIRDGRSALAKNQDVFDKCGALLADEEAILLFPEANHNLKRRVRPLSKGFTRILNNAFEKNTKLDVHLVPVGQNYQSPERFGDRAKLCFGKPIAVQNFVKHPNFVERIKQAVFESLTQLTTHVESEADYEKTIVELEANSANFLCPKEINNAILSRNFKGLPKVKEYWFSAFFQTLFYLINLPMVLIWRLVLKPKVPEPEFTGTYRFGFALLGYTFFCMLLFFVSLYATGLFWAVILVFIHLFLSFIFKQLA